MLLDQILFHIPAAIFWKDTQGIYLGCNQHFLKMAGLTSLTDIVGRKDSDLPWSDRGSAYNIDDFHVMETGQTLKRTEKVLCFDGEIIAETTKTPLYENNKIIGVLCLIHNITDFVKAKKAAESASSEKSEFITNMSHDIRTPLAGIVSISQSLKIKANEPEEKVQLGLIHDCGQQLLCLLNDMLGVAHLDRTEEDNLRHSSFDLIICIKNICSLIKPEIISKQLDFDVVIDSDLPRYVVSNQIMLERVLLNLLGNSTKFTEKGTITLKVSMISKQKNVCIIRWSVCDTGIGILKKEQKKIFYRFVRSTPSHKGTYKGNGIGLYIAKRFVQQLGGHEIQIESKISKGAKFYFDLPMKIGEPPENKEECLAMVDIPSKENFKILLVEDSEIAQVATKLMLKNSSFDTELASNGTNALEMLTEHKYDLAIMDIGLPDISGIDITILVRQWEKTTNRHLPIIGLSAHIDASMKEKALNAGMDYIFTKPLTQEMVYKILSTLPAS